MTAHATCNASMRQPRGMRIPQYGHLDMLTGTGIPHSGHITVGSLFGFMLPRSGYVFMSETVLCKNSKK